jgi:hypothetical protein
VRHSLRLWRLVCLVTSAFEAPWPFSMVLPPKPIMPTESVGRLQSVTLCTREDRHFQSKRCGTFSLSQYIPHASKTCAETLRPRRCAARSRVPPSNVENAARVGASLHDGPRSRCHSAVRLVWRARSAGLGQRHCPGVAAVEDRILSRGTRRSRLLGKEVGGELRARRFAQGSTTPSRIQILKSSAVLPQTISHVLYAAAAPS